MKALAAPAKFAASGQGCMPPTGHQRGINDQFVEAFPKTAERLNPATEIGLMTRPSTTGNCDQRVSQPFVRYGSAGGDRSG
jgi:hypothetical protein